MNQKKNQKKNVKRPADRGGFILNQDTAFVAQEAYKTLRTNIMFALPGNDCKCIGVTSASAGEGKSTTAINLAISLAQIGKKVLLIDCDLRLPTVAEKLRIRPTPGLSDFIIGQVRIDEAICNVARHGIHVLPASSVPADPTGLLESKQMEHLFLALRRNYEYVIVDFPPVTVVTDSMILSRYLDGFLLTVREKQTTHRSIAEALRQMRMADAKILGIAVNDGQVGGKKYYKSNNRYYAR